MRALRRCQPSSPEWRSRHVAMLAAVGHETRACRIIFDTSIVASWHSLMQRKGERLP